MEWTQLKAALDGQGFDIQVEEGPDTWFMSESQRFQDTRLTANGCELTFRKLGAGTNKVAVLVRADDQDTEWVLLFGKPSSNTQTRASTLQNVTEEVSTLRALGATVPVPRPFGPALGGTVVLFEITAWMDGQEGPVPAFLMQFMSRSRFVEMQKRPERERETFARNAIVTGGRIPLTIVKTCDDLRTIRGAMATTAWGDFQVMYDKQSGAVLVFDPLPSDPNQAVYLALVDKWLKDIDDAIAADASMSHLQGATSGTTSRTSDGRPFRDRSASVGGGASGGSGGAGQPARARSASLGSAPPRK